MKVPVRKSHYETINKNHCFRIDLYLFGSDKQQAASKSELQKEQEKSAALQKEIEAMKKKSTIAEARAKVAKDTGVPIECLSGEDEDSCKAQAEAILKFAKPSGYPGVRKDTPPKKNSSSGTDDDMREFARQLFSR